MRVRLPLFVPPLVLAAAPAVADEGVLHLSVGYLHTFSWGDAPGSGPGFEVSLPYNPVNHEVWGGGPLVQASWLDGKVPRWVVGAEVFYWLGGLEVGWSHRPLDDGTALQGVHLGPFISLAFVSVGGRFVVPVTGEAYEAGISLAVKLPWAIVGEPRFITVPHGRPLRVDGRAVRAPLRLGRRLPPARLPRAERRALAAMWLEDALEEHASVAAFAKLARDLAARGAPAALVGEAERAAADEADHARRCFAVAGRLLGRAVDAVPVAVPAGPPPSLAEMALDSLREGCLGEAVAAEQARQAADQAEGSVAHHLRVIAADEARHARLSAQVVAWAEGVGGARVRRQVAEAVASLPRCAVPRPEPVGAAARAWGRLDAAAQLEAFSRVRARLV